MKKMVAFNNFVLQFIHYPVLASKRFSIVQQYSILLNEHEINDNWKSHILVAEWEDTINATQSQLLETLMAGIVERLI